MLCIEDAPHPFDNQFRTPGQFILNVSVRGITLHRARHFDQVNDTVSEILHGDADTIGDFVAGAAALGAARVLRQLVVMAVEVLREIAQFLGVGVALLADLVGRVGDFFDRTEHASLVVSVRLLAAQNPVIHL